MATLEELINQILDLPGLRNSADVSSLRASLNTVVATMTEQQSSTAIADAVADEVIARDAAIDTAISAVEATTSAVPSPFIFGVPAVPVADAALAANQIAFWSNDGSNLLGFKMKNSAGVVKIGTVALT